MGKQIFVPMTDEILYEHPELIMSPLTTYDAEKPCLRWLSEDEFYQQLEYEIIAPEKESQYEPLKMAS